MKRSTAVTALAVLLAGCAGSSITDNTGDTLPENRGTEVQTGGVAVVVLSELAWAPDESELYFESTDSHLTAVSLSGGVRQLDGPRDAYIGLVAAADGKSLYFAANLQAGHRTLYRQPLPTGTATVVVPNSTSELPQVRADGSAALPSRSGATVALTALPDSVLEYNPDTGLRALVASGCSRLLAFSPDSQNLICVTGALGAFQQVNVPSHTIAPLALLTATQGTIHMVQWTPTGVRVFFQNPQGVGLWDYNTQQAQLVWPVTQNPLVSLDPRNGDWTLDGSRIAFWVHECLKVQGLSTCKEGQSILHIYDARSNKVGVVAVAHGTRGGESIALSPSGNRVAYIFEGKIYLQPTAVQ